MDMEKVSDDAQKRTAWIGDALQGAVAHILGKTPRLKRLTLVSEKVHWTSRAEKQMYQVGEMTFHVVDEITADEIATGMPDPLNVGVLPGNIWPCLT
jgi:hypothetical protein